MTPLERRTPLTRKTPLKAGAPLQRKTPMTRASPPARTASARAQPAAPDDQARAPGARPARRRARDTGATRAQRDVVFARDGGRCARCGIDLTSGSTPHNDHHRQGRGMGGRQGSARSRANLPARRLTLCGSGATGCHGWVTEHPAEAERTGMVVRRGGGIDPARVPVLTWRGWLLLDDDGAAAPCEPPPGGDARSLAQTD